jgi:hypothetical protein
MQKRPPIPKQLLRGLSIDQLLELQNYLQKLIHETRRGEKQQKREVVEERSAGNKTYRLVLVRCGKETCKCSSGLGHGPYWYAYWSEKGRTRCEYVGKKLKL